MFKITSLHFPETNAQFCGFRQLLLFCDTIRQLLPAEDCHQSENQLVTAGLLLQYAPLPLGDDLGQFNRLVADIQRHGPDFYGSSFSSLSSSSGPQVDESSVLELITLMKPTSNKERSKTQADTLFQARLLLKLNDIHELEEKELREKILSINMKKANLLSALKGDEEELAGLAENLNCETESEPPLRIKQKLRAWASLLLAGEQQEPSWLITTGSEDAFDLLQDAISSQIGPIHLFSLSLADQDSARLSDQNDATFLEDFHDKTRPCRETLYTFLKNAAATGNLTDHPKRDEALAAWEKAVKELPHQDSRKIEFHLFPMPFAELLSKGLKMKDIWQKKPALPNTIIALLKEPSLGL